MGTPLPNALTIAGSDSSGGAGIQADIKTFSALGVYSASVITAVTAQNTHAIHASQFLPAQMVEAQLASIFEDLTINAVKIGMLGTADIIDVVCRAIKQYKVKRVVVDPVMVSTSGTRLLNQQAIDVLKYELFPLASLITPNLPEAAVLLDESEAICAADMQATVGRLDRFGAKAVLLKGGHLQGKQCHDLLLSDDRVTQISHVRIETSNTHGTGCTLSSAITAELAKKSSIQQAVASATEYLQLALRSGSRLQVGSGQGPVHHFHKYW